MSKFYAARWRGALFIFSCDHVLLAIIATESQNVTLAIGAGRRVVAAHFFRFAGMRHAAFSRSTNDTFSEAGHGQITQCEEGTAVELDAIAKRAKRNGRERAKRAGRERTQQRGAHQRTTERGKP